MKVGRSRTEAGRSRASIASTLPSASSSGPVADVLVANGSASGTDRSSTRSAPTRSLASTLSQPAR